jgi:hypothetical protein
MAVPAANKSSPIVDGAQVGEHPLAKMSSILMSVTVIIIIVIQ